jgi:hypothetical protein
LAAGWVGAIIANAERAEEDELLIPPDFEVDPQRIDEHELVVLISM